ncbi:hypothetical protein ACMFMG_006838 [Clarireedia jacksonii]
MVHVFRQMMSRSFIILFTALFIAISFFVTVSSINQSISNNIVKYRSPKSVPDHFSTRNLSSASSVLKVRVESPEDLATYNARVAKGRFLACLMAMTLEEVPGIWGGESAEALIQDPRKFVLEGWNKFKGPQIKPLFEDSLNTVFQDLQIPLLDLATNQMPTFFMRLHNEVGTSFIDGLGVQETVASYRRVAPSSASYSQMYSCRPGVIVADVLTSPSANGWTPDDPRGATRIFQWSDAAFLDYMDVCHDKDLQWVIQSTVINEDTRKMVKMALRNRGIFKIPLYGSRITFHPHTDPFYAILGSKNGGGIAYLLGQHKTDDHGLGLREVKTITIWASVETDISNPSDDLLCQSPSSNPSPRLFRQMTANGQHRRGN